VQFELFIHPRVFPINSLLFTIAYRTSQIFLSHQFFILNSKRMQRHRKIHKIKNLIFSDRSKIILDHASWLKYLSHTPGRWEDLWHTLLVYLPHPNHWKNPCLILLQLCMTEEREYLIYGYHPISFLDCFNHQHLRTTARKLYPFMKNHILQLWSKNTGM
jgi:hypothetical protein